jgi:hypothetical protein
MQGISNGRYDQTSTLKPASPIAPTTAPAPCTPDTHPRNLRSRERSSRAITPTLITHKRGTTSTIAHRLPYALTSAALFGGLGFSERGNFFSHHSRSFGFGLCAALSNSPASLFSSGDF